MIYVIVGCEVGFWVLVALGLIARYWIGAKRLGLVLLAATPLIDLLLLAVTALDLHFGGDISQAPGGAFAHGLAALYVGISLVFGRKMIKWADAVAAKRAGRGPGPVKRFGSAYAAECWRDVARALGAAAVSAALLKGLDLIAGTPLSQTGPLLAAMFPAMKLWLTVELIWAASYTVWPKKAPEPTRAAV